MYICMYVYAYICACMCICVYGAQAKTLSYKRLRKLLLLLDHHQKATYLYFGLKANNHTDFLVFSIAF